MEGLAMGGAFVTLARDSSARQDFVRRSVETSSPCAWCGGYRWRAGTWVRRLWQYGVWGDGAVPKFEMTRRHPVSGVRFSLLFCSKDCHDAYHGR